MPVAVCYIANASSWLEGLISRLSWARGSNVTIVSCHCHRQRYRSSRLDVFIIVLLFLSTVLPVPNAFPVLIYRPDLIFDLRRGYSCRKTSLHKLSNLRHQFQYVTAYFNFTSSRVSSCISAQRSALQVCKHWVPSVGHQFKQLVVPSER